MCPLGRAARTRFDAVDLLAFPHEVFAAAYCSLYFEGVAVQVLDAPARRIDFLLKLLALLLSGADLIFVHLVFEIPLDQIPPIGVQHRDERHQRHHYYITSDPS